ncbi:hypothetical protein VTL71DRAFT_9562 [Oculimacula yallundae]|uniref:Myb-like domain-containing protein n=1 Tax=Oculimacula yallundae TaxID=86028 RepID=A0ABR4BS16_9HELO
MSTHQGRTAPLPWTGDEVNLLIRLYPMTQVAGQGGDWTLATLALELEKYNLGMRRYNEGNVSHEILRRKNMDQFEPNEGLPRIKELGMPLYMICRDLLSWRREMKYCSWM